MNTAESVRERIRTRYDKNPRIHISVTGGRRGVVVYRQEATITGVYPYMFRIDCGGESRTVPYSDVLTGELAIDEIGPSDPGRA